MRGRPAWLGAGYLLTTRVTRNDGLRFWLVASAWLALAAVCIWRGRSKWVLWAAVVPIAVSIVAIVLGLIVALALAPEPTSTAILCPTGTPEALVEVALLVSQVTIVGSYLVLAVGAISPTKETKSGKDASWFNLVSLSARPRRLGISRVHYYTRWQGGAAGGGPADWNRAQISTGSKRPGGGHRAQRNSRG